MKDILLNAILLHIRMDKIMQWDNESLNLYINILINIIDNISKMPFYFRYLASIEINRYNDMYCIICFDV